MNYGPRNDNLKETIEKGFLKFLIQIQSTGDIFKIDGELFPY